MNEAQQKPRTAEATKARIWQAEDRAARRLQEKGWFTKRTGEIPHVTEGMQLYATNGMGETYRVAGWSHADAVERPILIGRDGQEFPGVFDYLYTVGPK